MVPIEFAVAQKKKKQACFPVLVSTFDKGGRLRQKVAKSVAVAKSKREEVSQRALEPGKHRQMITWRSTQFRSPLSSLLPMQKRV